MVARWNNGSTLKQVATYNSFPPIDKNTTHNCIFGAWETRRKHIQCGLFSVKRRWHLSFANISELLTGNANRQLYTYSKTQHKTGFLDETGKRHQLAFIHSQVKYLNKDTIQHVTNSSIGLYLTFFFTKRRIWRTGQELIWAVQNERTRE